MLLSSAAEVASPPWGQRGLDVGGRVGFVGVALGAATTRSAAPTSTPPAGRWWRKFWCGGGGSGRTFTW